MPPTLTDASETIPMASGREWQRVSDHPVGKARQRCGLRTGTETVAAAAFSQIAAIPPMKPPTMKTATALMDKCRREPSLPHPFGREQHRFVTYSKNVDDERRLSAEQHSRPVDLSHCEPPLT